MNEKKILSKLLLSAEVKFIYSEKATKFLEIYTGHYIGKIYDGYFSKFGASSEYKNASNKASPLPLSLPPPSPASPAPLPPPNVWLGTRTNYF